MNEIGHAELVVNCAGLFADDIARAAGAGAFKIYPRKGEFFVFEPPDPALLEVIRLSVPSAGTKGVLVFPTVDGKLVAGPTAHDQRDKRDWSVRAAAQDEVWRRPGSWCRRCAAGVRSRPTRDCARRGEASTT